MYDGTVGHGTASHEQGNPDHPIIQRLNARFVADPNDPKLPDWYGVLVDQALLAEGSDLRDPAGYVTRVNSLLADMLA